MFDLPMCRGADMKASLCCHLRQLCLLQGNRFCAVATSATMTSHFTFLQFIQTGEAECRSNGPAFNWRSGVKWASSVTWWHCFGCTSINWSSYRSHYSVPACHNSSRTKMIYTINPSARLWFRQRIVAVTFKFLASWYELGVLNISQSIFQSHL